MGYGYNRGFRKYVSAAERLLKAEREMEKLKKKGVPISPVVIQGRTIARTFWGKAWCDNLTRYSDYSNRLPRGRAYVSNGSVVDLQIAAGQITARVSGTRLYQVTVNVAAVPEARWTSICSDCAGAIDSLVELLQGRLSNAVMERICQQRTGLFPAPDEIEFSCSCPDWASMCKHVAAVLYGIGARLDEQPELLFKLRKVDEKNLIAGAGAGLPLSKRGPAKNKVLADDGLSELFGLEIGESSEESVVDAAPTQKKATKTRRVGTSREESKAAAKPKAEKKPKAEAKPKAEKKSKVEAKPKAEKKPKAEAKPKAEKKSKVEAKPKAEKKPKAEAKPKAEKEPKAVTKPKTSVKKGGAGKR
jgi:uncharacterized Zn finger protein